MNMKKVSLDTWIQLLGMLSVLAGLLFVGLEMRQSQRIAIGAQQQTRAQMGMETAFHWSDNDMDSAVFFRANDSELTKEEISYLRTDANVWWYIYESDFEQYELGLMEEEVWQAKLRGIESYYNLCVARDIYQDRSQMFSENFKEVVLSMQDKCNE